MEKYVGSHGLNTETDIVEVTSSIEDLTVTVELKTRENLFFARVLGFNQSDVGAKSTAILLTGGYGDIIPLALQDDPGLEEDDEVYIKFFNPPNPWAIGPGNFAPLALGARGADQYRENIKHGFTDPIWVGEEVEVETEPGNMSGPTSEGYQYRIDNNKSMTVVVPVVDVPSSGSNKGRSTLMVRKFAVVEIDTTRPPGDGNDNEIVGFFKQYIEFGDVGGGYSVSDQSFLIR